MFRTCFATTFGEMIQFDRHIFQLSGEKRPTSLVYIAQTRSIYLQNWVVKEVNVGKTHQSPFGVFVI